MALPFRRIVRLAAGPLLCFSQHRVNRRLLFGCAVVLTLCSCISTRQHVPQAIDPLQLAAWYGQPRAVAATLLLKTTDATGDSTQVTIYLWRAADGRTRLLLTKVDVDVLSALIQADGSFTAFAPRSGLRTAGDLSDPDLPAGLADLRLLLKELCDGPLPPGLTKGEHDNVLTGPTDGGLTATVTVSPTTDEITEKDLHNRSGGLVYLLRYSGTKDFDGIHRATKVDTVVGNGSSLTAYLRRFEVLGDISPERMRFAIPDTATAVPPAEFLEHLDQ